MTDCLNCFNCKLLKTKRILRCKVGFWINGDSTEKVVKLSQTEISNLDNKECLSPIVFRNLFLQGKKCPQLSE